MEKLVLRVPQWQGELVFSKEILLFVGVILLMVVGILFCFWGYKFLGTILFMGIGIVACYGSYLLVEPMTANVAIRMFLTVSLTFLSICFVYFLSIIWGFILDKLRIRTALEKRTYLLAALVGAAILGLTVYYMIWRDEIVAGVVAAVGLVIGVIFQHSKRKKQVRFRSYDDLLKLPRPQFDEDGLKDMSMGTADIVMSAVPIPEYAEPEALEPENAEPEALEPENTEPEALEPENTEPEALEPENTEPEFFKPEPEALEQQPENTEPEVLEPECVGPEARSEAMLIQAEAIKPEAERKLAYRREQIRSKKSKKRKRSKGAAFAGGAALMAVGLGLFITNRVSKGGGD